MWIENARFFKGSCWISSYSSPKQNQPMASLESNTTYIRACCLLDACANEAIINYWQGERAGRETWNRYTVWQSRRLKRR